MNNVTFGKTTKGTKYALAFFVVYNHGEQVGTVYVECHSTSDELFGGYARGRHTSAYVFVACDMRLRVREWVNAGEDARTARARLCTQLRERVYPASVPS